MRSATTTPEPNVSAATIRIAAESPSASAARPAPIAPIAYPRSRHSRYTPTADPRHDGCATSPIAASSVGWTIAVPAPSSTAPRANHAKLDDTIEAGPPGHS